MQQVGGENTDGGCGCDFLFGRGVVLKRVNEKEDKGIIKILR